MTCPGIGAEQVESNLLVVVVDRVKKDDIFHYGFISSDASGSPFWNRRLLCLNHRPDTIPLIPCNGTSLL